MVAEWIPRRIRESRFSGVYFTGMVLLAGWMALRLALLARCWSQIDVGPMALGRAFVGGLLFDLVATAGVLLPTALWVAFLPDRLFCSRFGRGSCLALFLAAVYLLSFGLVAEWLFWDEFEHRLNFIAVDYLVYTNEVLANIGESYPVVPLLAGILALSLAATWFARHIVTAPTRRPSSWFDRLVHVPVWAAGCVGLWAVLTAAFWEFSTNSYVNEVAKNGPYSLVAAFRDSTLNYENFYARLDRTTAFDLMRVELANDNSAFTHPDRFDLQRLVSNPGPERQANVIILLVESLSGDFVGALGDKRGLTPRLDELTKDSLFFTNFYATGTRTVRGMEAVTLSLPPTPGCAVIKRPTPYRYFSIFDVFQDRGYDTAFMMGGNAYFDNHGDFFAKQGCRVLDRSSLGADEVRFANAWGVCDEDLFGRALREADERHAQNEPFCFMVLTCSNHRPYTYPTTPGIAPNAGREGAVRYTDHAIGEMLEQARSKPWFDNTVFVVVADHCASSAGKTPVPAYRYHIPLWIHAPKLVPPGVHEGLCSQIDVAPTLLGLLNFTYESQFFGTDMLKENPDRALIGTYQRLGLLTPNHLTLLDVKRRFSAYHVDTTQAQPPEDVDAELLNRTIAYYQSASELIRKVESPKSTTRQGASDAVANHR